MNKVTKKQLESIIERINKAANTSLTYCDKVGDAPFKSNIGHYHLDWAYGGVKLVQTDNECGGVRDITRSGFTTKGKLYHELEMFLMGLTKE